MTDRVERIRQALAGRYEIERELGSGGMATVYLARDLKHDRLVAMKVLHPELAASLGSERFLREIQVTARLSHPHILPLYDSGEADGLLFYTMPFIEGESLHDFIKREKQLAIPEAVRIAREVAEGLAIAHSYGLVHRDIKPQNILLSGGHAVIADFGIATAVSQAQGEKLTQTGMSVGTPAYMSPEQASGLEVDGRSDVYSLGCVLYEMLVGQVPFTGPTPQAIIARHTMDQITAPHIMRDTIPDELEDVIYVAMAKSPADRYRTAQEFADALMSLDSGTVPQRRLSRTLEAPRRRRTRKRPAVVAMASAAVLAAAFAAWMLWPKGAGSGGGVGRVGGELDPRRIAVLYFDDLSSDSSLQHVADALTEGLIEHLSAISALDVVSRNGVAAFRHSDVGRDSVARALQAGTVVLGSMEPASRNRVRITTRLADGASGADVGRRTTFVLPVDELATAQDSVARDVARVLREWLGAEIQTRELRAAAPNNAAWLLVQRAEKLRKDAETARHRDSSEEAARILNTADSLLAEAEEIDANWLQPTILRAWVSEERALATQSQDERLDFVRGGLLHAGRAADRESTNPHALAVRGRLRYRLWQIDTGADPAVRARLLDQAQNDLEEAVRIEPGLASAHATLSSLHYAQKSPLDGYLAARAAYNADAYLDIADLILYRLFWGSYDVAQFREARRWCDTAARRFPDDWRFVECQLWMMTTPDATPSVSDAWRLAGRLDSLVPASRRPLMSRAARMLVGAAIGKTGDRDSADAVFSRARSNERDVDPTQELLGYEAIMRSIIGDVEGAMAILKRYVATHPDHSFERGGMLHWWWQPLKNHPDFAAVVRTGR